MSNFVQKAQQESGTSRVVGVAGFEPATPCSQSKFVGKTILNKYTTIVVKLSDSNNYVISHYFVKTI